MTLPKSYYDIAQTTGVTQPLGPGGIPDSWDLVVGRVTRSGIRRYFMSAYNSSFEDPLPWLRLWKQIQWTKSKVAEIHVRLPPKIWSEDKARLAALIAVDPWVHPLDDEEKKERDRALRWALR